MGSMSLKSRGSGALLSMPLDISEIISFMSAKFDSCFSLSSIIAILFCRDASCFPILLIEVVHRKNIVRKQRLCTL